MTADLPARPGPHPRLRSVAPSRWSLRTRLLTLLMVLLATVSLAIVFVTAVTLRGVLLDQLDHRLGETSGRGGRPDASVSNGYALVPVVPSSDPLSELTGAQRVTAFFHGPVPPDTLRGVIDSSGVHAAYLDSSGSPRWLTTAEDATVADIPADGQPHTATLSDLGDYRFLARMEPSGATVVTGLSMKEVNATLTRMTVVAGAVALAGVAAAAMAGTVIVRVTLRPLRRVAATASRVAELPLDRGEVALSVRVPEVDTDPRTEVGQVGAALNQMLGHIGAALTARHASETRMRQFLADVSHELRTPLAAISGYAELTRRTREPVPADVTYAMSRVESEGARMTALVSDLLLLARLDSGRPLVHEPVDISRLIVDVVSDAHVAAPGHRFALDLPEEPITVIGDPARLHQVLANLLANARTHTPPGTQVTTSLGVNATSVMLAVVDNGPGIPQALLPAVFERFARGDSSRSRAAGSTGLGLAIVAAVVEAHHGRVQATSEPGRTAFVVELPQVPPSAPSVSSTTANPTGRPLHLPGDPAEPPVQPAQSQGHPTDTSVHSAAAPGYASRR